LSGPARPEGGRSGLWSSRKSSSILATSSLFSLSASTSLLFGTLPLVADVGLEMCRYLLGTLWAVRRYFPKELADPLADIYSSELHT
jgi:hypothetical protein